MYHQTFRATIAIFIISTIATLFGFYSMFYFVNNQLSDVLEADLSKLLNREVSMGKVTHSGLTSVNFDVSRILEIPSDSTQILTENVSVHWNPMEPLMNRSLRLNIVLSNPRIYLEQDIDGHWMRASISPHQEESSGRIKGTSKNSNFESNQNESSTFQPSKTANSSINRDVLKIYVTDIDIQNGDIVLASRSKANPSDNRMLLRKVKAHLQIGADNQFIVYNVEAKLQNRGKLYIRGTFSQKSRQYISDVRLYKIYANDLAQFLPTSIIFQKGEITGTFLVQRQESGNLSIEGKARLNNASGNVSKEFAHKLGLPLNFSNLNKNIAIRLDF